MSEGLSPGLITMRATYGNHLPEAAGPTRAGRGQARPRGGTHVDDAEITAVYEAHRVSLYGYLLRMTRNAETAEDLLQETFIRLISEVRAGRRPDRVLPWLYRVAANAAISRARHGAVWSRLLPRLVNRGDSVGPEILALRDERDTELHAALAKLPRESQGALLLAAHGYAGSEIAASIGRTEGATRTLLCRSRVQVRAALEAAEASA